jgi:cation transporter-like permease
MGFRKPTVDHLHRVCYPFAATAHVVHAVVFQQVHEARAGVRMDTNFGGSLSGITLSRAIEQFSGIVVFQPIINGVGGSLSSIQASKISTMLFQVGTMGVVPSFTNILANPWRALLWDRKRTFRLL